MVALILFLFLVGFFVFTLDSRRRTQEAQHFLKFFQDTYNLEEITSGPLFAFIEKLHQRRSFPPICLLLFDNKPHPHLSFLGFHPLSFLRLPIAHHPFGIPRKIVRNRFPIILPKKWLDKLDENDLKWLICHEAGHIANYWRERLTGIWYLIGRPSQYRSDEHLVTIEMRADLFALSRTGLEQSITALRKIGLFSEDFSHTLGFNIEVFRRIAKLKDRFSNQNSSPTQFRRFVIL